LAVSGWSAEALGQGEEPAAPHDAAGLRDRVAMTERPTKITFAEMREMGVRGLLVYCADYHWAQPSEQ